MRTVAVLACAGLAGCLGGDALSVGAIAPAAPSPPIASMPTGAEADYLDTTVATLFRQRPAERSAGFVPNGAENGLAVCARSFDGRTFDHALVVLQRRIIEGPVSQVEDDAVILRGSGDTRPCVEQTASIDWIPAG